MWTYLFSQFRSIKTSSTSRNLLSSSIFSFSIPWVCTESCRRGCLSVLDCFIVLAFFIGLKMLVLSEYEVDSINANVTVMSTFWRWLWMVYSDRTFHKPYLLIVKLSLRHVTQMRLNNHLILSKPSERMRLSGDSGEAMLISDDNQSCNSGSTVCVIVKWILTKNDCSERIGHNCTWKDWTLISCVDSDEESLLTSSNLICSHLRET